MLSETKRAAIRRQYRMLRENVGKTQLQTEALARLGAGRYWKIENGWTVPTDDERDALARVLKVPADQLPTPAAASESEAKAS